MKYNLFIGRWVPFHLGHKTIIDSFLKNGKPVCVAIRETAEKYPVYIREEMIRAVYPEEYKSGLLKIISIPDITQVCIGRGVGYSIVEVEKNIRMISATKIREGNMYYDVPPVVKRIMDVFEEMKNGNIKPYEEYFNEQGR